MAILQRRHDADGAVPFVLLHRLGGRGVERALGFGHCFTLSLGVCEIVALSDRLRLRNLPGLVVHDHLGELVALHGVDGELELAVLHFVLRGDRLTFLCAGRQPTLERDLRVIQCLRQLRMLLVRLL